MNSFVHEIDLSCETALRAWFDGMDITTVVKRYLPDRLVEGTNSRKVINDILRALVEQAQLRRMHDAVHFFSANLSDVGYRAKIKTQFFRTLGAVKVTPVPIPQLEDDVELWFSERAARTLKAQGIETLEALVPILSRRSMWWEEVPGIGRAMAKDIQNFFKEHGLIAKATDLIIVNTVHEIAPLERQYVISHVSGAQGRFRAPEDICAIDAQNDLEAVRIWISMLEAESTQRAYRKEAERLILWSVYEMGKAMSSLTVEDALAYRHFLRNPQPANRWVGPSRARNAASWKPFNGPLAPQSISYSLQVLASMFRFLVEKGYVKINPFAGIKVRGSEKKSAFDRERSFSQAEWKLVRVIADGLEMHHKWPVESANRLRFLLDFSYSTGLRSNELIDVRLDAMRVPSENDWWLLVQGKGAKTRRVVVPQIAREALQRYLTQRHLVAEPYQWDERQPILASIDNEPISTARLWAITKRFFEIAAAQIAESSPHLAGKLKDASTHWIRHTHASHALELGADLTSVRDNLGHANITTTSTYLHGAEDARKRQMEKVFEISN